MATDGDIDAGGLSDEAIEEGLKKVDRDRFPINHARLMSERERRLAVRAAEIGPGRQPPAAVQHAFEFRATAGEYFRIWIVNLALTIATLGIYSAWASVRKHRFFYGNTLLAGSSFGYHGDPIRILKGRTIAAALGGAYFAAGRYSPIAGLAVGALVGVAIPFLVVKAQRFSLRVTSWRGVRFSFRPAYGAAYMAYLWWTVLSVLTVGLLVPYAQRQRYRFLVVHSQFGDTSFDGEPRVGRFYKTAFAAVLMFIALVVPLVTVFVGLASTAQGPPTSRLAVTLASLLPYVIILPIVNGYTKARNLNEVFNTMTLGPHRLVSRLEAGKLICIYFTNLVGIIVTLGMLAPWAEVRLRRYRLQSLSLEAHGDVATLTNSTNEETPGATAEEIGELFDFDFGL